MSKCAHCRFWWEIKAGKGECHRYPAVPWPKMRGDEYCGEFKPRPDVKGGAFRAYGEFTKRKGR